MAPCLWKKKLLIYIYIYINTKNLLLALKFIYLISLSQKIYKLTIKSQKWITEKSLYKKKGTYPNNKKILWTNYKSSLSKNNNNKLITNSSKIIHKNPITFTQFLPLIWKIFAPLKWLHPHSHRVNFYAIDCSIHTSVSITNSLD